MKAFQVLLALLAAFAVVWFVIYERRQHAIPSKSEKALALGWLVFRRVTCFSVAVFFGVVAFAMVLAPNDGSSPLAGPVLLCVFVALMAVWVGMYGGGRQRSMLDDRAVHQERKKRYGWKW